MKVNWLIQKHMLDHAHPTGFPNIAEAAKEAGFNTVVADFSWRDDHFDPPFEEGACVVTYGSHQFVSRIKKDFGRIWNPCCYHRIENLSYSAYSPYIGDLMLNRDYIILPYAEFVRRKVLGKNGSFIRPNAVTKAFTGMVITEDNWDVEIATLQLSNPDPSLLIVITEPKKIDAEFRFFVTDRKVVTGSEYSWDDDHVCRDVHPLCEEVAWEVAGREWQADTVFVVDVALINERSEAKVIEMNTASCAGLYSCSTDALVKAISESAWREYLGEDI